MDESNSSRTRGSKVSREASSEQDAPSGGLGWLLRFKTLLRAALYVCETTPHGMKVVEQLKPEWPHSEDFRTQDHSFKKDEYDRRHGVRSLPPIPDDSEVWITSDKKQVGDRTERNTSFI